MTKQNKSNSVISRLIGLENVRAFPNQFEVTLSGSTETASIKDFSFFAKRVVLGSYAVDAERILSVQRTILKKATVPDTITLTVKETSNWDILRFFYDWYTTAYFDPSRNLFISKKRELKRKNMVIYAFTGEYLSGGSLVSAASKNVDDGQQAYGFKIEVKNALLVGSINLPTFSYEEYTPVEHNFTLQSDDIKLVWMQGSGLEETRVAGR